MAADTLGCFGCCRCGLVMIIAQRRGKPALSYNREEWKRRCKRPDYGDPAHCIAEHDIEIFAQSEDWRPGDWRICRDRSGLTRIC
jgi:hypothetical protein